MSSTIIYHQIIGRIPKDHAGTSEDLFLLMAQMGCSNCYENGRNGRDGRRAREWSVVSFGTANQVMALGMKLSGDCEGGMLKMGSASKHSTPETYVRKLRTMLKDAQTTDLIEGGIRYQGLDVRAAISWREIKLEGQAVRTPYNLHSQESFRTFYQRYQQANGHTGTAYRFFEAFGPELR
jgi:hypothetical protein